MANGTGKVFKGFAIAFVIIMAIVLVAVLWRPIVDLFADAFPTDRTRLAITLIYFVLAAIFAVIFSRAGHFTAYGIVMGLGPGLWFLFWKGFPLFGLHPDWAPSPGLGVKSMIMLAILADIIITVIFVPLELREKVVKKKG